MLLRIEQNWKWSNRTFPYTLCVVSTPHDTAHYCICLSSNKNQHWASGGNVWTKNYILYNNFLLENWSFVR